MATITLEPHETFEHFHQYPSTTTLVRGDVEFLMEGRAIYMVPGVPLHIPAGIHHQIRNLGSKPASINCVHLI